MLGADLAVALKKHLPPGDGLLTPKRTECDVTNEKSVLTFLANAKPRRIINAAAFARVDDAEKDRAGALAANHTAIKYLTRYTADTGSVLVHFSTDQVFDGKKGSAYSETDEPRPLNYYSETKLMGERVALEDPNALVFRVQWLYGRTKDRFRGLKGRTSFSVFSDQFGAPTSTDVLSTWVISAMEKGATGLYHAVHDDYASWSEIFRYVLEVTGLKVKLVEMPTEAANLPAKRPHFSVLANAKLRNLLGLSSLGGFREPLRKFLLGNRVGS